jgi:hypothetical protein
MNAKFAKDTQRARSLQSRRTESADGAPWSPLPGVHLGPQHVSELLEPLLRNLLLRRLRHQSAATNSSRRAERAA